MELRRFYIEPSQMEGDIITIRGNEYRHMTGVLRFRVGYQAIVCDGSGQDYYCIVHSIDREKALLKVERCEQNDVELPYVLHLCLGNIKADKLEIAIQKAVEIGAQRITLFRSEYTSETSFRMDRIERIVVEACKQCGRAILPLVATELAPYRTMLDELSGETYLAYEKESSLGLLAALGRYHTAGNAINLIIGSEGGLTPAEVEYAEANGAHTVTLGKRILRAETASIVGLGTIACYTEGK